MKVISLSKEQKEMLLEMCMKLFPEYYTIYWNTGTGQRGSDEHLGFGSESDTGLVFEYIHWFELCMTELSLTLYRKLFDFSAENGYLTADTGEEHADEWFASFFNWVMFYKLNPNRIEFHPVNYLYQEFKKL